MPTTPLSSVQPGDVLAQPAATASGMLLLPVGTVLTEKHLMRLREAGIADVVLEQTSPVRLAELAERRAAIEDRFSGHDENPLMQALKTIVLEQLEQPTS